jgi:hypothetical protein
METFDVGRGSEAGSGNIAQYSICLESKAVIEGFSGFRGPTSISRLSFEFLSRRSLTLNLVGVKQ